MTAYVAPPGRKFQYDRDGSVGFYLSDSSVAQLTTGQIQGQNSEGQSGNIFQPNSGDFSIGVIFPELRTITAYYFNGNGYEATNSIQYSSNTTTGYDGVWTTLEVITGGRFTTNDGANYSPVPTYRTNVRTLPSAIASCKAVRFRISNVGGGNFYRNFTNFHLYGDLVAGQTPDRLRLWHPTIDQELVGAYFDLGDVMRTTLVDRPFRVKNNSATLTANNVLITVNALTEASPTVVGQITWDVPAAPGVFNNVSNIGNIAPGAISGIVTLRMLASATAALSLWRQRVRAAATTWS